MHSCCQLASILAVLWAVACSSGGPAPAAGGPPAAATGRSEASAGAALPTAAPPASRPDLGTVRFVFPLPAMTMLPMHVASVQGFDREEGSPAPARTSP